jgi:uncharacterized protein YxeA
MTEKQQNEIIGVMVVAALLLIVCIGLFAVFENNQAFTPEYVSKEDVLVAKQSEQQSINRFGEFRTNYYFLYESGELEKVELEEYMSFREGDTLERYKIKDE